VTAESRKPDDNRHRGLGRGLSALIGDEASPGRGEAHGRGARTVPVAFLKPNRFQPRKNFDAQELQSLAESIREKGVLQPILVRPIAGEADLFEIVAGERRWRAAQLAKLHDVPIVVRELNDSEALEFAIIENVQRADLNAVDEGAAYVELQTRYGYTQAQVSDKVGKSRSHIANTVRLLGLPADILDMIRDGRLSAGAARTLIGLENPHARAYEIVEGNLNVREAEQRSKSKSGGAPTAVRKDADTKALESSVSNVLGLKVEILHKGDKGGQVHISYRSLEQLDDIIRRLSRG
jgi:ParB family transcriptional regulator, chromosome partitioning protein